VSQLLLLASAAPVGIDQDYLLQARQMQALSSAVHIPLVCFGIAFPTVVLFVEWLYLRIRDVAVAATPPDVERFRAGFQVRD
jgi:cytochrome d ubiquinol oxidase subunit I